MRCPRCGREVKESAVFCAGCGAPLSLRAEPVAPLDTALDLDRRAPPGPGADPGQGEPLPPRPPAARPPVPQPRPVSPARRPAPAAPAGPPQPAATALRPRPRPVAVPGAPAASSPAAPAPMAPALAARPTPRPPDILGEPLLPEPPAAPPGPDLRLSQMPRERRPDVGPEPAPARPAPRPRPRPAVAEAPEDGTVEVVVGPMEVHVRRAPDWRRVLAWAVDGAPFAAAFALALRLALERLPHDAPLDLGTTLDLAAAELAGITAPILIGTLILFVVYHALCHGLAGATLGKRLLGLRVVGPDGRRPGFTRAAIRAVLAGVSLGILGLGVLLALFTRSGRALHDFLARTWVVEAP